MVAPGGACVVAPGGACVVLFGGACMVLFRGGMCGFIQGACIVLFRGACVVLFRRHASFYLGVCMVLFGGGVCVFFSSFGYSEIRSMSRRYASYWNAFLFDKYLSLIRVRITLILNDKKAFQSNVSRPAFPAIRTT